MFMVNVHDPPTTDKKYILNPAVYDVDEKSIKLMAIIPKSMESMMTGALKITYYFSFHN